MNLQCDEGYILSCLVSASYGKTSGLSEEVITAPNGCGLVYDGSPTECLEGSISCHNGRFEGCIDTFHGTEALTASGCSECVSVCKCGMNAPLFNNVADCFGDEMSTACNGEEGQNEQYLYLPDSVWRRDCEGKEECMLIMGSGAVRCYDDETQRDNAYYSTVNGEGMDGFPSVMTNGYFADCSEVAFKILAICEQVRI